jgi:OOP family OmpA-OmpF porin
MKNGSSVEIKLTTQRFAMGLLGLLVVVGCATKTLPSVEPLAVEPVSFGSGEMLDVDNIFILTDASGSTYMEETFPQGKSLSTSFLKALPDASERVPGRPYNVGYTGFGGDERVSVDLQSFDRSKLLSAAQQTQIMGQLDGTGGTTPIAAVLQEATAQLGSRSGSTALVLVSDGEATDAEAALAAGRALVESRSDPVCFHGVQLGTSQEGGAVLQSLAQLSDCGSVRTANSISTPSNLSRYAKAIVVGQASLPAVAAAPAGMCEGRVRLRGIEFGFDKANIDEAGAVVLDVAASTLAGCPNVSARIDGHTDSVGTEIYNQGLSERRADAVRGYFEKQGISSERLTAVGHGESSPIMPNDTSEGRARNRRVELTPK